MCKITAIVSAAGISSRMGKNKLLLPLGDKKLFSVFLDALAPISFHRKICVFSHEEISAIAKQYRFECVENNQTYLGLSHSVKLGVSLCQHEENFMFFVADQPLLRTKDVLSIMNCFKENSTKIIVPVSNGARRNPTIFPFDLKEEFLKLTGDEGGKQLIQANEKRVHLCKLSSHEMFFKDVDLPSDYTKIKSWVSEHGL